VQNKALDEAARKQLERILQPEGIHRPPPTNDIAAASSKLSEVVQDEQRVRDTSEAMTASAASRIWCRSTLASSRTRKGPGSPPCAPCSASWRKKRAALESELNSLIDKMEF